MAQEYAKSFYAGKAWIKCRDAFMKSKYYLCERCGVAALIVHHKEYITPENIKNPEITLNWHNLEALCLSCHTKEHFGEATAIADGIFFDNNGNPYYIKGE